MDGYALQTASLHGEGHWRLRVAGCLACGDNPGTAPALGAGECLRIFTGAAVPTGVDAVVMQEDVQCIGEDAVLMRKPVPGQNIRRRGEDAPEGSVLLADGTLVGAREIAAIASVGKTDVQVFRKVRIALFCTGDELRQPGQVLAAGQIYNSNRFMMRALLSRPWFEVEVFGSVPDDPKSLRETLRQAAQRAEIVVTTGGVSVGAEDHMIDQVAAAGGRVDAMKVAIKPGMPLAIGKLGDAIYIGLPGNPVAAYTTWLVIGARIAAACAGLADTANFAAVAEATESFPRRPGREEYRPARLIPAETGGLPKVQFLDRSYSAKVALLCHADGLAVLPADADGIRAGDVAAFIPM